MVSEHYNQVEPVWEIPNPKLFPPFDRQWSKEDKRRFIVLFDISLPKILEILDSSYDKIFSSEGLMNPLLNQKKIEGIIFRWDKGLPIDPPFLFWNHQTQTVMIENGIHRLSLAFALEATNVPILINRYDFNKFRTIFKLKSL